MKWGFTYTFAHELSFFGRVGFRMYGHPFIGGFLKSLYFKKINKQILAHLGKYSCVLDAGCGNGEYAFYVSANHDSCKIDAVDMNKKGIQINNELKNKIGMKNVTFTFLDLQHLSFQEKYDWIYCIHTLEHIVHNRQVLKNFHTALKQGGFAYIDIPQKNWHEYSIFNPRKFQKYLAFEKKEHIGEQYTLQELCSLLEDIGFEIVHKEGSFGFFGRFAWEVDQILMENTYGRVKAICLPFLKLLCYLDLLYKGNCCGVTVLVKKPHLKQSMKGILI